MIFLVTGAAGCVGLALVERFLEQGLHVFGVDLIDLPTSALRRIEELPGRLDFVKGDVRKIGLPAALRDDGDVRVVNCAVVTPNPDVERAGPREVVSGNVDMVAAALDLACACGSTYFLHVSSGGVYGNLRGRNDLKDGLVSETHTQAMAQSLYAISKLASEQVVERYSELFGLPMLIARVALTFGPWERITGARSLVSAPHQILAHARAGRPVVLERDSIRGWTSSRDIARALAALTMKKERGEKLMNVATPHRWPLSDFVERLRLKMPSLEVQSSNAMETNTWLRFDYDAPNLDVSRMLAAIGSDILMSPAQAIEDHLGWAERYWSPEFDRLS